jgi:hypothetical protein
LIDPDVAPVLARAQAFRDEAHLILGRHEAAPSRVIILKATYEKLGKLSLSQDDMLRQALRCSEQGLYRAAHVMAWAAFVDFLFEKLNSDGLVKLRAGRPRWVGKDIFEMAEWYPDHQFIDAARDIGFATKNEAKQMISLLDRRNECAHPTAYYPDLNMTLGYVSQLLQLIASLQPRPI